MINDPNHLASTYFPKDVHIHIVGASEKPSIEPMRRAVLFVLANWSMAAFEGLKILGRAIATVPSCREIEVYVFDTDTDAAAQLFSDFREVPRGYGETFWIRDGKVIARITGGIVSPTVMERNLRMLDAPGDDKGRDS